MTPAHRADRAGRGGVAAPLDRLRAAAAQRWRQFRSDFAQREAQLRAELLPPDEDLAEAARRRGRDRTES